MTTAACPVCGLNMLEGSFCMNPLCTHAPKGSREEAFERTYPEVERILGPSVSRSLRGGFKAGWEEAISAVRAQIDLRRAVCGYFIGEVAIRELLAGLAPPEPDSDATSAQKGTDEG